MKLHQSGSVTLSQVTRVSAAISESRAEPFCQASKPIPMHCYCKIMQFYISSAPRTAIDPEIATPYVADPRPLAAP